uniref:Zinc finger PHD-type domain-containing protein n=1 Tax=Chromera velia CCMP2878 TaxID=1169474 RepID=A0A0G4HDS6_9ALVE|eukprot:Cvel_6467.t1-p1 / transcript=Cvel_6467.t1 / gene=Cvel_6467 / organism=Chromera_velia_CCMP2878 / gene_product=hypothetical protein / transcript_product=hypothetical protein / location=Cvel_scaffold317:25535-30983(-) / protein_length=938 / sequence_SO=supercontig / SO=protein_coding / is_pseudo=false
MDDSLSQQQQQQQQRSEGVVEPFADLLCSGNPTKQEEEQPCLKNLPPFAGGPRLALALQTEGPDTKKRKTSDGPPETAQRPDKQPSQQPQQQRQAQQKVPQPKQHQQQKSAAPIFQKVNPAQSGLAGIQQNEQRNETHSAFIDLFEKRPPVNDPEFEKVLPSLCETEYASLRSFFTEKIKKQDELNSRLDKLVDNVRRKKTFIQRLLTKRRIHRQQQLRVSEPSASPVSAFDAPHSSLAQQHSTGTLSMAGAGDISPVHSPTLGTVMPGSPEEEALLVRRMKELAGLKQEIDQLADTKMAELGVLHMRVSELEQTLYVRAKDSMTTFDPFDAFALTSRPHSANANYQTIHGAFALSDEQLGHAWTQYKDRLREKQYNTAMQASVQNTPIEEQPAIQSDEEGPWNYCVCASRYPENMVECAMGDDCPAGRWFHVKCTVMSMDEETVARMDDDDFIWKCPFCDDETDPADKNSFFKQRIDNERRAKAHFSAFWLAQQNQFVPHHCWPISQLHQGYGQGIAQFAQAAAAGHFPPQQQPGVQTQQQQQQQQQQGEGTVRGAPLTTFPIQSILSTPGTFLPGGALPSRRPSQSGGTGGGAAPPVSHTHSSGGIKRQHSSQQQQQQQTHSQIGPMSAQLMSNREAYAASPSRQRSGAAGGITLPSLQSPSPSRTSSHSSAVKRARPQGVVGGSGMAPPHLPINGPGPLPFVMGGRGNTAASPSSASSLFQPMGPTQVRPPANPERSPSLSAVGDPTGSPVSPARALIGGISQSRVAQNQHSRLSVPQGQHDQQGGGAPKSPVPLSVLAAGGMGGGAVATRATQFVASGAAASIQAQQAGGGYTSSRGVVVQGQGESSQRERDLPEGPVSAAAAAAPGGAPASQGEVVSEPLGGPGAGGKEKGGAMDLQPSSASGSGGAQGHTSACVQGGEGGDDAEDEEMGVVE